MTGPALTALQAVTVTLVMLLGVTTVLVRRPLRQVIVNSMFGLALVLAFCALQAPDAAISELIVSTVAVPMIMLTVIYKTRGGGRG